MELFLGVPVRDELKIALENVDLSLFSAFVRNDSTYLNQISHDSKIYLGKFVGVVCELPQLELTATHIQSLLHRLLPHFSVETLSLHLFPIPHGH